MTDDLVPTPAEHLVHDAEQLRYSLMTFAETAARDDYWDGDGGGTAPLVAYALSDAVEYLADVLDTLAARIDAQIAAGATVKRGGARVPADASSWRKHHRTPLRRRTAALRHTVKDLRSLFWSYRSMQAPGTRQDETQTPEETP